MSDFLKTVAPHERFHESAAYRNANVEVMRAYFDSKRTFQRGGELPAAGTQKLFVLNGSGSVRP